MQDDPDVIWLSPRCPKSSEAECGHPEEIFADAIGGRMWCEDCYWGECPECGAKPIRYVREADDDR